MHLQTERSKQETSSFKREIYSLYNVLRSMIILYFFCCVKGIVALHHHHMALCIIEEFLIYLFYRDLNRPKGATATLLKTYRERVRHRSRLVFIMSTGGIGEPWEGYERRRARQLKDGSRRRFVLIRLKTRRTFRSGFIRRLTFRSFRV
jgi:hypothetical protein